MRRFPDSTGRLEALALVQVEAERTQTIVGMIAFCFGLERVVLRKLLGRPIIAVIMATIGLASTIRGVATLVFGAGVRSIELPVGDEPLFLGPIMLPPVQLVGAGVGGAV